MSENLFFFDPTKELDILLSTTPPNELKKSLSEIFKHYLLRLEEMPDHDQLYKQASDFYLIYKFLEKVEKSGKYNK